MGPVRQQDEGRDGALAWPCRNSYCGSGGGRPATSNSA